MNRFPLVLATAFLAVGCGKDSSDNKAECQVEAIDLPGCDRSTLSVVQADGIWNTNINFDDGFSGPFAIRFSPGEPLLVGFAMTEKQVTPDTFFLASNITGSDGSAVRYAFAGCKASGPGEVLGVARVCRNGSIVRQGTFTARRVARRAGESESDRVELVGQVALPRGAANGVSVAGDYAYVIAGSEGLFVFDVKDPAHPSLVSEQKIPTETYTSTLVSGTTLYLGTYATGIRICDLAANPAVPTCDKTVLADLKVRADGMTKDGNLLYVASPQPNSDIVILDVTTPSAPTLVVRYTVDGAAAALGEFPYALAVQDNRLYVSNWSYGVTVSDLAPLATSAKLPKILGRYAGPSTSSLAVGKLGDNTVVFQGSDAWGSSLLALDATNPANIVQRGQLAMRPEATLAGMALSGTTLYVANYQDGLRVYDVSTLTTPKAAGYFNTWSESDTGRGLSYFDGLQGVQVANGLVYGWDTTRGLLIFRHTP